MCVLNILILLWILMLDDFQMFHRFAKLARAFVILYRTSTVESPLAVILLPWYTKSLTSSVLLLLAVPLLSFFELIFINFVSLTFILSPICLLYLTLSSILYFGYPYVAVLVKRCHLQSQDLQVTVIMSRAFLCRPVWWWFS